MKYYSETLDKLFDSSEELTKEEEAYNAKVAEEEATKKKLAEERKERAKRVENARIAYQEAYENYVDELKDFCKDYKTYHVSYSDKDVPNTSLWDVFWNL